MRYIKICGIMMVLVTIVLVGGTLADTLDDVRVRGYLRVGVNGELFGFGMPDEFGVWRGLDVDTARAIAAAIFGDAGKIEFIPLTAKTRFMALQSGAIDVLCHNVTRTLYREAALGLNFVQVNYYDGQGFMAPKKLGIKSAKKLDGAKICVLPGTTTEENVKEYFRINDMTMEPVVIESTAELANAFFAGHCDCLTSDTSQLAGNRALRAPNPHDYIILPEIISKEPLAPVVRDDDARWYDIVNFSVLALIAAEELGLTSANVDEHLNSQNPRIRRFLGVIPGNGNALGLDERWAYHIVKHVGNYGEIFERNVGRKTPLGLERGLNKLWIWGGLMTAPPFK